MYGFPPRAGYPEQWDRPAGRIALMRDFITFMITIFVAGWGSAVIYTVLRFFWKRQNRGSLPRGDEHMLAAMREELDSLETRLARVEDETRFAVELRAPQAPERLDTGEGRAPPPSG